MRKITLSPGSGYFHVSTFGAPTPVPASVISLTPRPSCWNVARRRESGLQVTTGSSPCVQPALLVA
jgi:hypothetical protein